MKNIHGLWLMEHSLMGDVDLKILTNVKIVSAVAERCSDLNGKH